MIGSILDELVKFVDLHPDGTAEDYNELLRVNNGWHGTPAAVETHLRMLGRLGKLTCHIETTTDRRVTWTTTTELEFGDGGARAVGEGGGAQEGRGHSPVPGVGHVLGDRPGPDRGLGEADRDREQRHGGRGDGDAEHGDRPEEGDGADASGGDGPRRREGDLQLMPHSWKPPDSFSVPEPDEVRLVSRVQWAALMKFRDIAPDAKEVVIRNREPGSQHGWLEVDLVTVAGPEEYAIWKANGDIYHVGPDGAVGDDPIIRGIDAGQ